MKGFVKRYPMLFVGGKGSVTHMHFDIDLSHIVHTQFVGRKRVLLFPFEEQHKLYRKPWEVLSFVNFENYFDENQNKLELEKYPALRLARGYEVILEHGDTLFMPAGYWHHMEYLDSGFAMSLRALQTSFTGKLKGIWYLMGMRNIDTLMKRTAPEWWFNRKKKKPSKRPTESSKPLFSKGFNGPYSRSGGVLPPGRRKIGKKYCFLTKLSLLLPRLHTLNNRLDYGQPPKAHPNPISSIPTVQFPSEDSNSIDIRVQSKHMRLKSFVLFTSLSPVLL
ncbi:cupin-like domain-containing protein [Puia sp. P3]|uniref:cupin-like domain-containing protein n=1 Tax=Puia sp. P3 TaxID=3423952 RepID=UPI003D6670D4